MFYFNVQDRKPQDAKEKLIVERQINRVVDTPIYFYATMCRLYRYKIQLSYRKLDQKGNYVCYFITYHKGKLKYKYFSFNSDHSKKTAKMLWH